MAERMCWVVCRLSENLFFWPPHMVQTPIRVSIIRPIWKQFSLNQDNNGSVFLPHVSAARTSVLSDFHHHRLRTMTLSFLPNNAFPLPSPLTPKLVMLGLDNETATTVSKVYLSAALGLKETCETEYIRACNALMATSDDRGYSSRELRSKLLAATVTRYMQALSKWMEDAIGKAEASLRRNKKLTLRPKVRSWP